MLTHMINLIVWDIETVPDLQGFAAANGHIGKSDDSARATMKSVPNWARSSQSIFITRSSASARWLHIVKKAVIGPWMRSGHRMSENDQRKS